MEDLNMILELIASFLGGALVASVSFMLAFTARIASVETTLVSLCKKVDDIEKKTQPQCSYHPQMAERLMRVETIIESGKVT
jgi:hypothetical protein